VVPSVRGPEQSREPQAVLDEVRQLAGQGVLEVTLLGQTVNGYRHKAGDGRQWRLSDVLAKVQQVDGIERVKFVTNFPRHMTPDLLEAVRDLSKVCPYLHVPAQSGSDTVLRGMKRGYTAGYYRDMAARVRETLPEAALSSDFIVGFPGETPADFDQSAALVEDMRFHQLLVFKYSVRPSTVAAQLLDDVPLAEKKRRNHVLLDLQEGISQADNDALGGRTVRVLIEGRSKLSQHRDQPGPHVQLTGRTATGRIVVFTAEAEWIGRIVPVRITGASPLVLFGEAVAPQGAARVHWSPLA
jgi:tRNA-2-methylthio-N6-dimethylallyladenosine synthase